MLRRGRGGWKGSGGEIGMRFEDAETDWFTPHLQRRADGVRHEDEETGSLTPHLRLRAGRLSGLGIEIHLVRHLKRPFQPTEQPCDDRSQTISRHKVAAIMAHRFSKPKHAKMNSHSRQQAKDIRELVGFLYELLEGANMADGYSAVVEENKVDLLKARLQDHFIAPRTLAVQQRLSGEADRPSSATAPDASFRNILSEYLAIGRTASVNLTTSSDICRALELFEASKPQIDPADTKELEALGYAQISLFSSMVLGYYFVRKEGLFGVFLAYLVDVAVRRFGERRLIAKWTMFAFYVLLVSTGYY